jgi:serine/threonine-protein kinase
MTEGGVIFDIAVEATGPVEPGVDPELSASGRYRVCVELASGGMGTVYLALYRGTDGFERVVALKRMHPHLSAQGEFVRMFFDEAQVLARVKHPSVCALIDLGKTRDSYFLVMEYIAGEPLSEVVRALSAAASSPGLERARVPLIAARIFARLCEGLHAVHEIRDERGRLLNVVHRDVTPHNLYVLYDGTVRVTDFGIAHSEAALHQTAAGVVMGKVAYLAPEQMTADAMADRRWDVWSMGVALWEVLCGRRLFTGKTLGSVPREIEAMPIPAPSTLNPYVPTALDAVVMQALERKPEARFATARAMGLALERVLADAGDSVPAAHVAAWLDALFPGRAAQKRGMRAMALNVGTTLAAPSVPTRRNGDVMARVSVPSVRLGDARVRTSVPTMPASIAAAMRASVPMVTQPVGVGPKRASSVREVLREARVDAPRKAPREAPRGLWRQRLTFAAAWLGLF